MAEPAVPVVDIAAFLADPSSDAAASVAAAWDAAFREYGIVYLTGHGVPEDATSELASSATTFFSQSDEAKMASCLHQGYGKGGFVPVGVEAVARSRPEGAGSAPDAVENIVFSHAGDPALESVMPSEPPTLQPSVAAYWAAMRALLGQLMQLSAKALGLPGAYFDAAFERPKCNLRLAHYPPMPADADERAPGVLRYGAHTDYTGFTILRPDPEIIGLEAQAADGVWISVPPRPGALIVNAGDLLQVWTNDRWRSAPHRVVNPPPGSAPRPRLSLVFFTGPADDTVVEPLPNCHGPEVPKKYEPVSAREHLLRKLGRSNTDVLKDLKLK